MRLIWTKNKMPLSWLIRWGLDEPVSHFAVVFDDRLVFHSNLKGVHVEWFDKFKKTQTIVYSLNFNSPLEKEESVYLDILGKKIGKSYDFIGFMYFCYVGLKKKVFGLPIPKENKLNQENAFLCTELGDVVYNFLKITKKPDELAMISPFQLYVEVENHLQNLKRT